MMKVSEMMVYVIGRPINGISLNGLEYLLDDDKVIEFNDYDKCLTYIKENVTDVDPEDYLWQKESDVE